MPMLSPDGIKRVKGEEETSYQRSLPTVEPDRKGLQETSAGDII